MDPLNCLSSVACGRRRTGAVKALGWRGVGLRVRRASGLLARGCHVGLSGHHGHHGGLLLARNDVHGHVRGGDHDDGSSHAVALVDLDAGADEDDEVRDNKEANEGQRRSVGGPVEVFESILVVGVAVMPVIGGGGIVTGVAAVTHVVAVDTA